MSSEANAQLLEIPTASERLSAMMIMNNPAYRNWRDLVSININIITLYKKRNTHK